MERFKHSPDERGASVKPSIAAADVAPVRIILCGPFHVGHQIQENVRMRKQEAETKPK